MLAGSHVLLDACLDIFILLASLCKCLAFAGKSLPLQSPGAVLVSPPHEQQKFWDLNLLRFLCHLCCCAWEGVCVHAHPRL